MYCYWVLVLVLVSALLVLALVSVSELPVLTTRLLLNSAYRNLQRLRAVCAATVLLHASCY